MGGQCKRKGIGVPRESIPSETIPERVELARRAAESAIGLVHWEQGRRTQETPQSALSTAGRILYDPIAGVAFDPEVLRRKAPGINGTEQAIVDSLQSFPKTKLWLTVRQVAEDCGLSKLKRYAYARARVPDRNGDLQRPIHARSKSPSVVQATGGDRHAQGDLDGASDAQFTSQESAECRTAGEEEKPFKEEIERTVVRNTNDRTTTTELLQSIPIVDSEYDSRASEETLFCGLDLGMVAAARQVGSDRAILVEVLEGYAMDEATLNAIADRVIDKLNEEQGVKAFRHVEGNRKSIRQRLRDGVTEAQLLTLVEHKCAEWQGTQMESYLRPVTLFGRSTHFDGYLAAAVRWDRAGRRSTAPDRRTPMQKALNPTGETDEEYAERLRKIATGEIILKGCIGARG
jgi:uncharacterized phage protein (TIGR02220 family)